MHKPRFLLRLLLLLYLALATFSTASAIEDTACLFCHQYPGLVRLEQDQTLTLLHIDPERYLASTHGKLGCADCHKGIKKIPHAGATQVDCQTGCHTKSDKDELYSQTSLKSVHQNQQSAIIHLQDQTSCKVCHPVYPHSQKPFTRAWLNMHTSYLICESCHLKKDHYPNLSYQWITTREVSFNGRPFGSYFDPDKKHTNNPSNSLSRIVPVIDNKGVVRPLVNLDETEKAKAFHESEAQQNDENRRLALNYYHREIAKMDAATACDACHSTNGLLDFKKLGFTDARTQVLINTNINSIVSHYENFYIPKILE